MLARFSLSFAARGEPSSASRSAPGVARARAWWFEHRDKAPDAFDDDIAAVVEALERAPLLVGRRVETRSDMRRVNLERIRYSLYFRVDTEVKRVLIVALWHGSRAGSSR